MPSDLIKIYILEETMNYEEALEYIHGIYWRGSKLGLTRTEEILRLLGNPQKELKFIHVAGTNGKGSTCAMLESVFRKAGYNTGLYISPYIIRFNERMQYNGTPISDEELAEITEYVSNFAESMKDKPTEFELVTAIGMEYFKRKKCDIVILETGLGGELDSTNIIDTPEAAVITAIDIDHIRELGGTMESVASAKAGIIKGGDVFFYGQNDKALKVFVDKCQKVNASLTCADFSTLKVTSTAIDKTIFDFTVNGKTFSNIELPLTGTYQIYNAALVLTVLDKLSHKFNISEEAIKSGIASVKWPGRFEILCQNPTFIADGGHNPHGIKGTVDSIQKHFPNKKIIAVLGVMADKDTSKMFEILAPLIKSAHTVEPPNPRAMKPRELADRLSVLGINATAHSEIFDGVKAAFDEANEDDIICALGSFYMYADILDAVKKIKL